MNRDPHDPLDAREWQAQERARLQASNAAPAAAGAAGAADDDEAMAYRAIAWALRQPLPDALPADFASRVAARCGAATAREAGAPPRADTRLEQRLLRGLACALAVATTAAIVVYGGQWLPAILLLLPADAWGWVLTLGGCVLSTLLLEQRHRRATTMPRHGMR